MATLKSYHPDHDSKGVRQMDLYSLLADLKRRLNRENNAVPFRSPRTHAGSADCQRTEVDRATVRKKKRMISERKMRMHFVPITLSSATKDTAPRVQSHKCRHVLLSAKI